MYVCECVLGLYVKKLCVDKCLFCIEEGFYPLQLTHLPVARIREPVLPALRADARHQPGHKLHLPCAQEQAGWGMLTILHNLFLNCSICCSILSPLVLFMRLHVAILWVHLYTKLYPNITIFLFRPLSPIPTAFVFAGPCHRVCALRLPRLRWKVER